jgi:uncharacterized repeat protein (TIGR03843 family)
LRDIFEHLENGTLEVTGRLVDASNATLYATCTLENEAMPVIYKPVAGERPLWDFPDGNLAQREYAAFLISELGEFHVVPPTLLRDGPFGPGMIQQWIDIDKDIDLAEFYRTDDSRLRSMALFDAIINNTDRKIGHLLPHPDGRLLGCDHGVTFHEEDKLRTVLWQWADSPLNEEEKTILIKLKGELISQPAPLLALITEIEFESLVYRIDRLIQESHFPAPSDEWPAVPWPPF